MGAVLSVDWRCHGRVLALSWAWIGAVLGVDWRLMSATECHRGPPSASECL
jgi:hypothetical protein